ncbi:transcription antitermination factor NusB [Marinigracilibium pacificum]|uniref:Transcription antitermination protein NusB n=1 Tax=Marinigracilibium pacificum TaxID=2729599 RepID=A0A848IQX8_9BACT|nr:transcription antitermination factor NusB [Marinigracilibium pacificum]NMM46863.1 transcription antitermination factor NusB [Marinigracilibium pacificum]
MINRRILRIKAMQSIFAYLQSKNANRELARNLVHDSFLPDLNANEVQDKDELKKKREMALAQFDTLFAKDGEFVYDSSLDEDINNAIEKSFGEYGQQNDKDRKHLKRRMVIEAEEIYNHYLMSLKLIVDLADPTSNRYLKEDRDAKFINNTIISLLKKSDEFENSILRKKIDTKELQPEVEGWFKSLIRDSEEYKEYLKKDKTFEGDKAFVQYLVKNIIFKNQVIMDFFEQEDIHWTEDKNIVKSLALKTIKESEEDSVELRELSYNWEDDKVFFEDTYDYFLDNEEEYEEVIAEKTKNWDVERLATTDRIILMLAVSEMINFPNIPVKVTINEFIEISKKYSTPKSRQFVNGVLDVIANDLKSAGKIKKSGRGLLDNK